MSETIRCGSCGATTTVESYNDRYTLPHTPGCDQHPDNLQPYVRPDVEERRIIRFQATVGLSVPVKGREGWWSQHHVSCDHFHKDRESADRCAVKLARAVLRAAKAGEYDPKPEPEPEPEPIEDGMMPYDVDYTRPTDGIRADWAEPLPTRSSHLEE